MTQSVLANKGDSTPCALVWLQMDALQHIDGVVMGARLLMTLVAAVEETVGKASLANLKVRRSASESGPSPPPPARLWRPSPLGAGFHCPVAPCSIRWQPPALHTLYYIMPGTRARLPRQLWLLCPYTHALLFLCPPLGHPARARGPGGVGHAPHRGAQALLVGTNRFHNCLGCSDAPDWTPYQQLSRHAGAPLPSCLAACTRPVLPPNGSRNQR